jgi:hypothetical protein
MKRILRAALAVSAVLLAAPALACEGPKAPPPNPTSAAACPFLRAHGAVVVIVAAPTCPFLEAQGRKAAPPAHRFEGVRVITASATSRAAPAVAIAD